MAALAAALLFLVAAGLFFGNQYYGSYLPAGVNSWLTSVAYCLGATILGTCAGITITWLGIFAGSVVALGLLAVVPGTTREVIIVEGA